MVFMFYFFLGDKDTVMKEIGKLSLKEGVLDSNIYVKVSRKIADFPSSFKLTNISPILKQVSRVKG